MSEFKTALKACIQMIEAKNGQIQGDALRSKIERLYRKSGQTDGKLNLEQIAAFVTKWTVESYNLRGQEAELMSDTFISAEKGTETSDQTELTQ